MEHMYRSKQPGYVLTLWKDGEEFTMPKTGRHIATFVDTGKGADRCGIFRTHDDEVAAVIESSSKFNKEFIRIKTPEEIQLESLKKKRKETQDTFKSQAKKGLINFDKIEKMKKDELVEFAEDMGVEVEGRTKADILDDVRNLVPKENKGDDDEEAD